MRKGDGTTKKKATNDTIGGKWGKWYPVQFKAMTTKKSNERGGDGGNDVN